MKLYDISSERYSEVMEAAPALIEKLAANEEFKAMMFKDDLDVKGDAKNAQKILSDRVLKHLPKLMVSAKTELVSYFALLNGVSEAEYAQNMTVGKVFDEILDALNDKVFLNFFYSYQTHSSE